MKSFVILFCFFLGACKSDIGLSQRLNNPQTQMGLMMMGGADPSAAYMAVNHPEYYSDYQEQADRRKMIQQQEETNTQLFFLNGKLNSY